MPMYNLLLLNDQNSIEEGENTKESKKETAKSNFDSEFSLSGIKIVKQCYEKNKFVKVTVLLDEKSIKKANKILKDKINLYPESLILGQFNEDLLDVDDKISLLTELD